MGTTQRLRRVGRVGSVFLGMMASVLLLGIEGGGGLGEGRWWAMLRKEGGDERNDSRAEMRWRRVRSG